MYDVQTASSLGNDFPNGQTPTFTVGVPTGRVPISAGYALAHQNRGYLLKMYKSSATEWTFQFGGNASGNHNTVDLYVYHTPALTPVEVLGLD